MIVSPLFSQTIQFVNLGEEELQYKPPPPSDEFPEIEQLLSVGDASWQ